MQYSPAFRVYAKRGQGNRNRSRVWWLEHGTAAGEHGDRKGRHYHTRSAGNSRSIVVATLAVAM
ncbi:MAG: hypothetical protein ACRDIV_24980 [Ktedonobacteraceae bacterium]